MDSLPPTEPEGLLAAVVRCRDALDMARKRALHAARVYRRDPSPERLEDAIAAQVLLSYRQDDLAAYLVEVMRAQVAKRYQH